MLPLFVQRHSGGLREYTADTFRQWARMGDRVFKGISKFRKFARPSDTGRIHVAQPTTV